MVVLAVVLPDVPVMVTVATPVVAVLSHFLVTGSVTKNSGVPKYQNAAKQIV
jgi:hypothetical protein